MREKYESLSATVLRDLAKSRGIKSTSTMKKADLVEAMLAEDAKKEKEKAAKESEKKQEQSAPSEKPERKRADSAESAKEGSKEGEREEASQDDTIKNLDSGITVNGILRLCRMDSDLSVPTITCRVRMTFMCLHPRSVSST